ncbi:MAG: hypothetical protein RL514_4525 [Verrucomicrobiota bacterium]|jgi:restriction system protein
MKSKDCWLVRAGDGNHLIESFTKGHVLIGWAGVGNLSDFTSKDALKKRYAEVHPDEPQGKVNNAVSMLWKFCRELKQGDNILTYDRSRREYLYGEITSEYRYQPKLNADHPHERAVKWTKHIGRDALKLSSRNSLGTVLTLSWVNEEVQDDLANAPAASETAAQVTESVEKLQKEEFTLIKKDTIEKSFELIKDRIAALSEDELPQLVAAVLRAMNFKTKVSGPGSDRGVDVLASPDGLGLTEPRIKVEVKHRKQTQMSAPDVRKFLGGFRAGDRGLYVSSGGFTKEARYEADRAQFPISLVDLDDLTELVTENYERFDAEGRSLINLVRIYLPN